jgi:hypothetical protein
MTEGIAHCRIVMGKGGRGNETQRKGQKDWIRVSHWGVQKQGARWPNIEFWLKITNIARITVWKGLC